MAFTIEITEADLDQRPEGLDELMTLHEWLDELFANWEEDSTLNTEGVSRIILDALPEEDPEAQAEAIMESRAAYGRIQEWH